MQLFGVLNASPDSLNLDSIVRTSSDASKRAELLVAEGVFGFDLGGQGSTFQAAEVSIDDEWERLAPIVPVLAAYGRPFSVDTWRPATARRALEAGANWINAADGLQQDAMLEVAAEFGCPVVLPFLSAPPGPGVGRSGRDDPGVLRGDAPAVRPLRDPRACRDRSGHRLRAP
jgi:dihydropteroate synthase